MPPVIARAPGFDLGAAIDSAWTVFTDSLAALVAELGPNDSFILGLPTALDPAELVGVAPYVQILGMDKDYVRGEVRRPPPPKTRNRSARAPPRPTTGTGSPTCSAPRCGKSCWAEAEGRILAPAPCAGRVWRHVCLGSPVMRTCGPARI
jgi:hypothetical protein